MDAQVLWCTNPHNKLEFRSRADLWTTTALLKYVPAPAFGVTGMTHNMCDTIWKNLCWSDQPKQRPDGVSCSAHRWMLVDGFVIRFNEYCTDTVTPSELICGDKSMVHWYGQGGVWINLGLSMYVAIDTKPESGAEIQNSACGKNEIMLRLKVVKSEEDDKT